MSDFDLFDDDEYDFGGVDDMELSDTLSPEEKNEQRLGTIPNATIFLIDCHKTMQQLVTADKSEGSYDQYV